MKNKVILLVNSFDEQIRVGKIISSIKTKIADKKEINEGIRLSFEETKLITQIVVSGVYLKKER